MNLTLKQKLYTLLAAVVQVPNGRPLRPEEIETARELMPVLQKEIKKDKSE